jgi:hypothetical protein
VSSLSDDFDQAVRTIDPGPEPADEVIRRGKRIRLRRRIAAAAGAAGVLAAVLAGYPALPRHYLAWSPRGRSGTCRGRSASNRARY